MTTYRLTKYIDWPALHNERVLIDVSENYVIAVKRDGSFVILAQAIHARQGKQEIAVMPPALVNDDQGDEVAHG